MLYSLSIALVIYLAVSWPMLRHISLSMSVNKPTVSVCQSTYCICLSICLSVSSLSAQGGGYYIYLAPRGGNSPPLSRGTRGERREMARGPTSYTPSPPPGSFSFIQPPNDQALIEKISSPFHMNVIYFYRQCEVIG